MQKTFMGQQGRALQADGRVEPRRQEPWLFRAPLLKTQGEWGIGCGDQAVYESQTWGLGMYIALPMSDFFSPCP